MGLTEHEKQVLAELEKSLYADDADLARRFKAAAAGAPASKQQRIAKRRIFGALVALAGVGVILVGVINHQSLIGMAGFVVTLAGLLVATTSGKQPQPNPTPGARVSSSASSKNNRKSLRQKFEDRWDKRTGF